MNNNKHNSVSPLLAAILGGMAGALVVYLSDEKHRSMLMNKYQHLVDEGKNGAGELKSRVNKTVKIGRKSLAKKIRQVENRVAQS